MRFVEPKSPQQQARAMVFRTRDLFVRQRTQTINALRAHLAEHGLIAPQGMSNLANIRRLIDERLDDIFASIAEARISRRAKQRMRVDNGQDAEFFTQSKLVVNEVHRPDRSARWPPGGHL